MSNIDSAGTVMERIEALAHISEEPGRLTRTFCSPAMRQANELVGSWMREAGMTVSEDAIGNLIGRYPGRDERAKTFLLGSHLDTVRDAGKFDGPLGVLTAIACVQHLHQNQTKLPFAIEVIGFADEEGVRYQTTYLGSKALAGTFNEQDLKRIDSKGVSMAEAIKSFGGDPGKINSAKRDPHNLLGYAEVHIEQGPILEKKYQPVGVVSAIAGQMRIKVRFTGRAGHAGTTPMNLRHDALVAAAEFILAVESSTRNQAGLVATVGQIEAKPGASNVIPGEVNLTRGCAASIGCHPHSGLRHDCRRWPMRSARSEVLTVDWDIVHEAQSVPCSRDLSGLLAKAARQHLVEVTELPSGAGHDAAVMGEIMPVAMLFVRCKGGISHHPDESVEVDDVRVAIAVMNDFLVILGKSKASSSQVKRMSELDLLLRGGTVVTATELQAIDVGVADGKIVALEPGLELPSREVIDARGLHIFPGVIDAHVHFNEPGRAQWEGFETGTRALAAGGGTLFFDMPLNAHPPTVDAESFDLKTSAARARSLVDFAFWGGLVPGNLDRLEELAERGVVGFKAFMSNSGIEDFQSVDDHTLREGMKRAAKLGKIVAVHAESDVMTQELAQQYMRAGKTSIRDYLDSRPIEAELDAIQRALAMAGETGCALHIVHVSCGAGIALIAAAQKDGGGCHL